MHTSRGSKIWMTMAVVCGILLGWGRPEASMQAQQQDYQAMNGRELFSAYCASCHGANGTGNGPAASAMRRTPPDLTALALNNGGTFPTDRIGRIIDGRDVEAHGDREMPVWGDAFKAIRGGHSEQAVRARIESILQYLISIQRRRA